MVRSCPTMLSFMIQNNLLGHLTVHYTNFFNCHSRPQIAREKLPPRVTNNMAETEKLIPVEHPSNYGKAAAEHGELPIRKPRAVSGAAGKPLPRTPFPLDIPVLTHLRGKRVILASASPRRKQILSIVLPSPPTT